MFINFPRPIYQGNLYRPYLTPQKILQMLNPAYNPLWQHARYQCFLAMENQDVVGRITAVIDYNNPDSHAGFFGAFEASQQIDVAEKLFAAAENWLAGRGRNLMLGPVTFNTNQQIGVLIEGFDEPPQYMMPYNPPYYQKLMESCGFKKATDLFSYSYPLNRGIPEQIIKIADRVTKKEEVELYSLNLSRLPQEITMIKDAFNQAMAQNWGYTPLTYQEAKSLLNYCRNQGSRSLLLLGLVRKKPAALCICLPTPQKNSTSIRIVLLSVVPKLRFSGLEALLIKNAFEFLLSKGYVRAEFSQVEEGNNMMNKIIQKFDCRVNKLYRVYKKYCK